MYLPDHDTFGMLARLDLHLPTNLMQRVAYVRARHELGTHPNEAQILTVVQSLQVLNQYARNRHGDYRHVIYALKQDSLHALYACGYLFHLDVEQQILRCHSCINGIWERDTGHAETCFKCGGTGIYKRIRLLKFTVRADNREFVFHQPDELAKWAWALVEPALLNAPLEMQPKYKAYPTAQVTLSNWQLQRHLLRVANFTASMMLFEDVKLQDWKRAFRNDCRQIARHVSRRISYAYQDLRTLVGLENELPF